VELPPPVEPEVPPELPVPAVELPLMPPPPVVVEPLPVLELLPLILLVVSALELVPAEEVSPVAVSAPLLLLQAASCVPTSARPSNVSRNEDWCMVSSLREVCERNVCTSIRLIMSVKQW
jgi:hypothetical protein